MKNWFLNEYCKLDDDYISYDSEFMNDESYYGKKLAVVQLHTPNAEKAYLFNDLDLVPWQELKNKILILHSGYEDLRLFNNFTDFLPKGVMDLQIAYSLLSPEYAVSYSYLVEKYLNISLAKRLTCSDWLAKNLSQEQLSYASEDVIYLSALFPLICQDLKNKNRFTWWEEENKRLMDKIKKIEFRWFNLSNWQQQLNPKNGKQFITLNALCCIREKISLQKNRNRRLICSDEQLINMAKSKKIYLSDLPAEFSNYEEDLYYLLRLDYADIAKEKVKNNSAEMEETLNLDKYTIMKQQVFKFAQEVADNLGINIKMLINKSDLSDILMQRKSRLMEGWRSQFFQDFFNKIL